MLEHETDLGRGPLEIFIARLDEGTRLSRVGHDKHVQGENTH